MLRSYPPAAIAQNWVHEALSLVVQGIHEARGGPPPKNGWLSIIDDSIRPRLERRRTLKSRIDSYAVAVAEVTDEELVAVITSFEAQNEIEGLLDGSRELGPTMPPTIAHAAEALFVFGFDILSETGTRDHQYTLVWQEESTCPFCGIEFLDAPSAPREDLDHYLVRARYPFAAANLKNLVPMGSRCNRSYKKQADMIRDRIGNRRRAFYPYGCRSTAIVLEGAVSIESGALRLDWSFSFDPASTEADTWDDVFSLRTRLARDLLNVQKVVRWIGQFGCWCRLKLTASEMSDAAGIREAMLEFARDMGVITTGRDAWISPVFRLLHSSCSDSNGPLLDFVVDVVHCAPTH